MKKEHILGPKPSGNFLGKFIKKVWKHISPIILAIGTIGIILTFIINLGQTSDLLGWDLFNTENNNFTSKDSLIQKNRVDSLDSIHPPKNDKPVNPNSLIQINGLLIYVIDSVTGYPIDNVDVSIRHINYHSKTDKTGKFLIPQDLVDKFPSYKSFEGEFLKEGYFTLQQTIGFSESVTLKLTPKNE